MRYRQHGRAGGGLSLREKGCGVLLHQAVEGGLLWAVTLVVNGCTAALPVRVVRRIACSALALPAG